MRCPICRKGDRRPGTTTVLIERDERVAVFQGVPASVCENCGEAYTSAEVTERLFEQAEEVLRRGDKISLNEFRAA